MAQLERYPKHVKTTKSLTTPSVDKFLRVSHESFTYKGSPTSSPSASSPSSPYFERSKFHDPEDHHKKSVLTKVKEKAKKLRISLSKKKHEDGNVTPPSCATIEEEEGEEEEEDAEYLGAPMYESELAPQSYKENARQHPRASPVIAENHVLRNPFKSRSVETDGETPKPLNITVEHNRTTQPAASNKTMNSGNVAEKLAPARTKSSDSTLSGPSKIQNLTVSNPSEVQAPSSAPALSRRSHLSVTAPQSSPAKTASKTSPVGSKSPRFSPSAPSTPRRTSSSTATMTSVKSTGNSRDQTSEKGVSVKEFIDKLEAGEDEKALSQVSQVISEAMNPKRTPGDVAVMEKVREAVTSLLRNDEPTQYAVKTTITRTSSQTPVSANVQVQEVAQEESHGRILQAN